MKRMLKKSLNQNELNTFIQLGSLDQTVIKEHFSLDDISLEGSGQPYVDIPGVTMVFDLAGSSASIRQDGPNQFVETYASIFSELTEIIYKNKGVVEKFPGDGISAHFIKERTEANFDQARQRAATCAIKIREFMNGIGRGRSYRICMWTGSDTIATTIGSIHHKEIISIGHGVNVAHKLEKFVKEKGCVIGMDSRIAAYFPQSIRTAYEMPEDLRQSPAEIWYGVSQ